MSSQGFVVLRTSSKESLSYLIKTSAESKLYCELQNGRNILFYVYMYLN